ncbi:reverse transcriptase domain-containing protein [Tanacetum coccineum]
MQSLSEKLETLNRFLARSVIWSMTFFKTLKNITKENKDDYRWSEDVDQAFQDMKKLIIELPTLTTPMPKETLYVYLVASQDVVSGVLRAKCKGKQTPIRYVSQTLHDAERNYAPLEKLALCLLHLSQSLQRYFEVHLIKKMKVQALKVNVDSNLVACQLNGEFVVSSEGMTKYLTKAKEHVALIKKFSIQNIPRNQNQKAGVLSKLSSMAFNHLTNEILIEVLNAKSVDAQEISTFVKEEGDNWMTLIIKCLEEGICPINENKARNLRMKISQYVMEKRVMFKKSYLAPMLRCVGPLQENYVIKKVHEGACGMHSRLRSVVAKTMR